MDGTRRLGAESCDYTRDVLEAYTEKNSDPMAAKHTLKHRIFSNLFPFEMTQYFDVTGQGTMNGN